MRLLNFIFIKPIAFILEWAFLSSYHLTGNYGVSLVFMSLIITLITIPLYYLAERWKRAETVIQNRMAGDLNSIKEYYTGQKKYYLTQACYRLHDYRPFYSIRVSFGILIQVPFFLAAYQYLSHYTGYQGVSFLIINDLSRPDSLLFGRAILPFVMTFVNLMASWMYSKDKNFSDKLQLVLMALAFLVLLYDRPAALLIYWTMNNVFGIFKTMLFMKIFPPLPSADGATETFSSWYAQKKKSITPMNLFIFIVALYYMQSAWHDKKEYSFEYLVPVFGFLALVFTLWALKILFLSDRRDQSKGSKRLFLILMSLLWIAQFSAGILWVFRLNTTMISQNTLKRLIIIFQDGIILLALLRSFPAEQRKRKLARVPGQVSLFLSGLTFLGLFYFLASPLLIYVSSPSDVNGTPLSLIIRNIIPFLLFISIPAIIFRFSSKEKRGAESQLVLTAVLMVILYFYILPSDYGVFNGLALEKEGAIFGHSFFLYLFDIAVLIGLLRFSELLLKGANRSVRLILILLSVSLCGQVLYEVVSLDKSVIVKENSTRKEELPENYDMVHSYSKEETNIVYFVADMFVGGYMRDIVKENPEIKKALEGFVWYPNTLSVSYRTVTSMPAMFGGWDYTAEAMNETPGPNRDKYEEAFRKMVDPFLEQDYTLSTVNPQFLNMDKLYPGGGVVSNYTRDYRGYWEKLHSEEKYDSKDSFSTLFTMATIMKSAPYSQRKFLYDHSGWIVMSTRGKFGSIWNEVLDERPFLQLLPQISNTRSETPTFKYFHSDFTHSPFGIDKEGNLVRDTYPDPTQNNFDYGKAAYYTALDFMRIFTDYVHWLKENGVYDNTMIILVSDHGNDLTTDDPFIPDNLSGISKKEFSRAHALLMVKKEGEGESFAVDERFMSNADVPAIIRGGESDPTAGEPQERTLNYYNVRGEWNRYLELEKSIYKSYRVRESIYYGNNWIGE